MTVIMVIFWLSVALILYPYVIFPVLVYIRGRLFPRPYQKANIQPHISMVMAVYNEEGDIRAKLENINRMDYPVDKLEVVIASDGSTDRTNEILQQHHGVRINPLLLPRVGKARALNAAVEQAQGEILIFSDANSLYAPDALQRLVAPFADPNVGGVAGNQLYTSSKNNNLSQSGEKSYWNFDRNLKRLESRAGNVISATGAIYAIRRSLFQPIVEGVTDDFYTSTAVIEQGRRLVFEEDAISYEAVTPDANKEFKRKVRIISRGLRSVIARRKLLNPFRYGFYALQLFSHKVLRRLVVFPMLAAFFTNLILWQSGLFYTLAAAAQVAFYGASLVGYLLRGNRSRLLKPVKYPFYFTLVNVASLLAVINVLRGNQIALWVPHRAQSSAAGAAAASASAAGQKKGNGA